MNKIKNEWFGNNGREILAGLVVAIALIPEAIAFSLIAGLNPMVGLYAAFCIAIITAFAGGRTGMISGATGAMALVLAGLVKEHGVEYVLIASILAGVIQIVFGLIKVGSILRFIPRPVMTGFVNALGILIFKSQIEYFVGEGVLMYILVAVSILIIFLFPKINKIIPAPLVAIVILTAVTIFFKMDVTKIGDLGTISNSLPSFLFPNVSLNLETLKIILPVSLSLAAVGLVESLLTAQLLDEMSDTSSNKNRECIGQGLANIVSGFFGGMAGCAMIGQSVINFKSGGRKRLSTFLSGAFLMILIVVFNKLVIQIPVAVLVGVMIVVSIATFDWSSLKRIIKVPKTDTIVMIATVFIVLLTDNLAYGVLLGIILGSLFFVYKVSQIKVEKVEIDGMITYKCYGQLFFASTKHFLEKFDFEISNQTIGLDVTHLKFWDESAGNAFDKLIMKYSDKKVKLKIEGLGDACEILLQKTSVQYSILPEYVD